MTFARRLFLIAGWYGILVLSPMYFFEARIGREQPPAITHPEFFYGFIGVALAAQLMFLVIARDPHRYRALIPVGIVEKFSFVIPTFILYTQGRTGSQILVGAIGDLILGTLFTIVWFKTANPQRKTRAA